MTIGRTATVAILVLGLGACTTTPSSRQAIVKTSTSCVDQTVSVYFESQSAEIGSESKAVIRAAADAVKGCKITGVDILGLADAVSGAPDANMELSKRRAAAVANLLTGAGLPAGQIKAAAAGEAGAVGPKGAAAPLRRRADIVVHVTRA